MLCKQTNKEKMVPKNKIRNPELTCIIVWLKLVNFLYRNMSVKKNNTFRIGIWRLAQILNIWTVGLDKHAKGEEKYEKKKG